MDHKYWPLSGPSVNLLSIKKMWNFLLVRWFFLKRQALEGKTPFLQMTQLILRGMMADLLVFSETYCQKVSFTGNNSGGVSSSFSLPRKSEI